MPSKSAKCPECLTCMAKLWILPNRYYYCEICNVYYGGRDDSLQLQDTEHIHSLQKAVSENK